MRHRHPNAAIAAAATFLALAFGAPALRAGSATQVVVLLPGQTLGPGGSSGSPLPREQREPFVVRVLAVDASFARDYSYSGPLLGLHTSEAVPTAGLRLATSVSGAGAATTIPPAGGHLSISLNGENYRDYLIGPAGSGNGVCAAIVAALTAGNAGRQLALGCIYDASSSRYTLWMNDRQPLSENLLGTYFENSLTVDPAYGLAPSLHLGVSEPPSSDPNDASEFAARRLTADPVLDLVFDRGVALFSIGWNTLTDLGNETLTLDQGAAGLPVVSTPFEVEPSVFKINAATALGDGQGRINRVRLVFNHNVDSTGIASQASHFTLEDTGSGTAIPGTSLTLSDYDAQGYAADTIEVRFGTGLGKTDLTNIELRYTPPSSGILSSDTGVALGSVTLPDGPAFLIDEAPPVLLSSFGQDVDQNGGLDRMVFFFSEPVAFSGARGTSVSGFEPITNTALSSVPLPASLAIAIDGVVQVLALHHPTDSGASEIPGGSAVADAIAIAVRTSPLNRPAILNFTCEFVNGRYVLRAGIPLRPVSVVPSPAPDDVSALLKLGVANGGIERAGSGDAIADPADFIVLSRDGEDLRSSLLEGQGPSAFEISGNELQLELTNVPNSGTSTPAFVMVDNFNQSFISDQAVVPNQAHPSNNVGLPVEFHPSELIRIRDDDSAPDDGVISKSPGLVALDATQTIAPLLPSNVPSDLSFEWTQVDGPFVFIDAHGTHDARATLLQAGSTYVFTVTVTLLESGAPPAFNPYVHGDGTLAKSVPVHITPGPTANVVVLLPGQSLRPGVLTHAEAIDGVAAIATPGVPYIVRLVCTDEYFNPSDCPPGASAAVTTTDPADVEPPSRPLVAAGASFVVMPATPGSFVVDDELVGFTEMGDVAQPYIIGSVWNSAATKIPGVPGSIRLTWDPDPRPVTWNVYIGSLPLADLDQDGRPDLGYGSCATGQDPDPTDTTFDDLEVPPPGGGLFYVGTMVLDGQETSPGVSSAGLLRVVAEPCP